MATNDQTVVDAVGNHVKCKSYQRIVSLVPSITETLFDFGLEDRIVGVTRYCTQPPEARRPPRLIVGGSKSPNVQRIKDLNPDLIIINKEEQTRKHAQALQRLTTVFVTYPRTVTDVLVLIRQLSRLLLLEEDPVITKIYQETTHVIQKISQSTSRLDESEKPRIFCPIWKNPWMTINHDTFIHDMLTMAGGRNIFHHHAHRYPTVSLPEILEKHPSLILLPDEPYHFTGNDAQELQASFEQDGFPPPTVQLVNGSYLSWYGSRTRIGLPKIHQLITKHLQR